MNNPRTPGVGITRAWISLGSGMTKPQVASADPGIKDRKLYAAILDRQADLWLSVGRHSAAERLAHLAASLRAVAPASKPQIGRDGTVLKEANGRTKYSPVVTFRDKARRDLWSGAVVAALHAAKPEVLG
jgi:hypothetical protein